MFFAVLVVFSIILNRAVKHKTKELVRINDALETSKERYKILFEQAMHDITERRLAEAALRQSEEKFRVIFERAPIGIILSDSQSVVLDCNKHFADIFEAEKEQYYGMNLLERIPDCPVRQNLINALNDYELHIYEGNYVSIISKKEKYISISSQKISQNLMITIIIDMTEHKRAEEENKKLQRQLLQSHKMESIGRLAGGVAHDFNNMLGVIIGYTDILLDDSDINHPFYQGLCAIRQAAMRSSDLTKQLLAFARKQAVNPKKLNINSAVEDMLSMVKRVIGENIELILIKDEAIKDVKIDPTQIDQILVNLCVNAKDAVQTVNKSGGKITIETSNVIFSEEYCSDNSEALPGSYVMLAVSDNGCGMNKETLSFIFDPFFTTKDINKGTGLGLASVYGIVKQNKGFINVYSELNQGTAFKM
ncbi:PAS/PAC sensor hybrid histidine kinase [Candidatus Magnetoovum chiemensis]|nr:PAS/PAC sensor hybrid histidine kinase [Candidatus Magnetoovum chiemensis]